MDAAGRRRRRRPRPGVRPGDLRRLPVAPARPPGARPGNWCIEDMGSRNGTHVNGERVEGRRPLAPGDVVTVSGSTLEVHDADRPRKPAPVAAGAGDHRRHHLLPIGQGAARVGARGDPGGRRCRRGRRRRAPLGRTPARDQRDAPRPRPFGRPRGAARAPAGARLRPPAAGARRRLPAATRRRRFRGRGQPCGGARGRAAALDPPAARSGGEGPRRPHLRCAHRPALRRGPQPARPRGAQPGRRAVAGGRLVAGDDRPRRLGRRGAASSTRTSSCWCRWRPPQRCASATCR